MFIILMIALPALASCVSYRLGYINGRSHEHVEAFIAGVGDWSNDPYGFHYGQKPIFHDVHDDDEVEYAQWM